MTKQSEEERRSKDNRESDTCIVPLILGNAREGKAGT